MKPLPDAAALCMERFPAFVTRGEHDHLKEEVEWLESYGVACVRAFANEVEMRAALSGPGSSPETISHMFHELRKELGI